MTWLRGSKCSYPQAARKKNQQLWKSLQMGRAALGEDFSMLGSSKLRPSSGSPGERGGRESSCAPSALMYPGGTDPASQAQSFVSLSPGLQKSICVFLKVRRHQKKKKPNVCCNTNTGTASVLWNQIKALKAANYAMEDLKKKIHGNIAVHASNAQHAGVRVRNRCFNLQYIQGAVPSNQFNFIKKYKNISSFPGELN